MKRIKTTVTYKVPEWEYCNHHSMGRPTKDMCRFCVKHGKGYICVLHNMPLDVQDGVMVKKSCQCMKATAGFSIDAPDPIDVNPADIMKATMKEYRKLYTQLIAQGYPDSIADNLAQKMLLKK